MEEGKPAIKVDDIINEHSNDNLTFIMNSTASSEDIRDR